MQNCLNFIEKDTQIQANACKVGERRDHILVDLAPNATLNLTLKSLSNPGVVQIILQVIIIG